MSNKEDRIIAEAAAWHAASAHDDMDWDQFTTWLEAAPRHRTVYDEIAFADDLLAEHRQSLAVADDPALSRKVRISWKPWAGAAIAASLVALLAAPQLMLPAKQAYETANKAREIALNDGSTITLAPHSTLTVEGRNQDHLALDGGAWFDIRHNPARQMTIDAGDLAISDIGTRFDVQTVSGHVRVAVADGKVSISLQTLSRPIELSKGHRLAYAAREGTALVTSLPSDRVGSWRTGRLSYDATPLALVAADLSRYAGVRVSVSDQTRQRLFSGTLNIGDGHTAVRDLSQLMDLELSSGADGYRLGERR